MVYPSNHAPQPPPGPFGGPGQVPPGSYPPGGYAAPDGQVPPQGVPGIPPPGGRVFPQGGGQWPPNMPPPGGPGAPPPKGPNRTPLWLGVGAGALVLIIVVVVALSGVFNDSGVMDTADPADDREGAAEAEEEPSFPSETAEEDSEADTETGPLYRFEPPCDVIDIETYSALDPVGDNTGDTNSHEPAGETGGGDCNFTGMETYGVYVHVTVRRTPEDAMRDYEYSADLVRIPKHKIVEPDCMDQWDEVTAVLEVGAYPFDISYSFAAIHSNFTMGMSITVFRDESVTLDDIMELSCGTMEVFQTAYAR